MFKRIAVFAGSFSLEAVQAVCATEGQSLDCSESLGELVRKSFVEKMDDAASRYRLHPLMRQYAAGKAGPEKVADYRRKAASFFLETAKMCKGDFDILDLERENILAGMDWAVEQMRSSDKPKKAAQMVSSFMSALDRYLDVRGYWDAYGIRLNQTIEAETLLEKKRSLAIWTHNLGYLEHRTGNISQARKLYEQNLEIAEKLGDQSGISASLHHLGMLVQGKGEYEKARNYYEQSLEIKQKLGNQMGISKSLLQLGVLAEDTGNYNEARKYYQQSFEIPQKLGDKESYAFLLAQSALLEEKLGNIQKAIKLTQQAESIFAELGAPQYVEKARKQREQFEGKINPDSC